MEENYKADISHFVNSFLAEKSGVYKRETYKKCFKESFNYFLRYYYNFSNKFENFIYSNIEKSTVILIEGDIIVSEDNIIRSGIAFYKKSVAIYISSTNCMSDHDFELYKNGDYNDAWKIYLDSMYRLDLGRNTIFKEVISNLEPEIKLWYLLKFNIDLDKYQK